MREAVFQRTREKKIIAIVRGMESENALAVARALYNGGIRLMEITYNQKYPDSWNATAKAIGEIAQHFGEDLLVGAGTVTSPGLVNMTYNAGGQFIISPDVNVSVIERTRELGMVSIPGALSPTEILTAHQSGADFVKLFPAAAMGVGYLKAVCAPISHIELLAVGGISEKNAQDFLAAGAVGLGVGGNLANREWIANGDFTKITKAAQAIVNAIAVV